jgi:HEAT repeat protein
VTNGRLVPQAASSGLASTVKTISASQTEPVWIGYTAPARRGDFEMCCGQNGYWGSCGLEPRDSSTYQRTTTSGGGTARLEGPETVMVLLRVEDKSVQKIRTFSLDCELDAGGRTIYWLDSVKGADSVAYLSSFVSDEGSRNDRLSSSALAAIAMHGDPSSVPALIKFARQDPSSQVRGNALFWLAQRAGEKAASEITAAIERDPDTEVKRRAVFALSQLPKDEGVPLLIQTARTNRNPVVRKQAMFWLGQSKDPRALAFFEEILGKN